MELRKVIQQKTSATITLPFKYCESLGIKKGDYLSVELKDNNMQLVKVKNGN